MFNAPDGVAIRKHLNRLEKRANRDLSHEDPQREMQRPILGQDKVHLPAAESCLAEPGALVENELAVQEGQQHHECSIRRSIASRSRKVPLPLY